MAKALLLCDNNWNLKILPTHHIPSFLLSSRILLVLIRLPNRHFQIDKSTDTTKAGFLPPHAVSISQVAPTFQLLEPNNPLLLSLSVHTSVYQILLIKTTNKNIRCIHFLLSIPISIPHFSLWLLQQPANAIFSYLRFGHHQLCTQHLSKIDYLFLIKTFFIKQLS